MPQMIFVNLPVADLRRSVEFYGAIGFSRDPRFSNDQAASMVLSDTICVMLLTHEFWATFTDRRRVDPAPEAQVLLCISRETGQPSMPLPKRRSLPGAWPTHARPKTTVSCMDAVLRIPMAISGSPCG